MSCQIGLYDDRKNTVDQWDALIYLQDDRPPRHVLHQITPFLREFHATQDMADAPSLAAWLTWYLIDASMASGPGLSRIAVSRQVRGDIDFFFKISPGIIEVYSIDEVLEWALIATVEILQETVELTAR